MSARRGRIGRPGLPIAVADLLRRAEEGSGGCLVVDRGDHRSSLVDIAATEALHRHHQVRVVVGSPATVGAFDAVRVLLDLDGPGDERGADRVDLERLRALAHRVDALAVDAPLLLIVDHAEQVDAASATFLSYLSRNLDARSVSVLLIAAEIADGSWLERLGQELGRIPHRVAADDPARGVEDVWERLASLDGDERRAVDALAVLGPAPSVAALAAVAAVPAPSVLAALDRLYEWDLLRRTAHGAGQLLVEGTVLDAMAPTRRVELHERAADHGRATGAAVEHVAVHLEHARPGTFPWAGATLRAAAARALGAGDARRSVGWLQRAIEEARAGGGPVPVDLLSELARAQARAGDPGALGTLHLAVERARGAERRALQLRLGRLHALAGELDAAVARFDEVLDDLDAADPSHATALVEARTAIAATCRLSLDLRERSASVLAALVPDPGAPLPEDPSLLAELAYEHTLAGTDRRVVVDLGYRALAGGSSRRLGAIGGQALFVAFLAAEDLGGVRQLCDDASGDPRLQPLEAHRRGGLALAEGDVDRAVAWSRMAVADIEWVAPMLVPGARAQLARALVRRGALDEAADALRLPGGERRWRQHATFHPLLLAHAELSAAAGEWRRAAMYAEECATFARDMGTHNPAVVPWQLVAAPAMRHLGRTAEATAVLDEAVARAATFGAPRILAELTTLRDAAPGEPGARRDRTVPGVGVPPAGPASSSTVLHLLGDAALVRDGEARRLGDDLVDRAVCIVALAEHGIHDEALAEALWPEGDPAVGRTRLRNVLARIRQRHGELVVRCGRNVQLADDVQVDLHAFERLAVEALASHDPVVAERLGDEALRLHRGELCPTLPFEPWTVAPRASTRRRWLALLDRLAGLAADRCDLPRAMAHFERAVEADPWDEDRYLDAAERLAAAGRPAAARAQLRRCEVMCADLGVLPSGRHAQLTRRLG